MFDEANHWTNQNMTWELSLGNCPLGYRYASHPSQIITILV